MSRECRIHTVYISCLLTYLPYCVCAYPVCRLRQVIPAEEVELLRILRQHMTNSVESSAYNWIRPSLWASMFAKSAAAAASEGIAGKL